jgi:hypothetical protein
LRARITKNLRGLNVAGTTDEAVICNASGWLLMFVGWDDG